MDICAPASFGDDRKQAGKRSDMKHYLFLGVFAVTRKNLSDVLCCISLEVNAGVYWCILVPGARLICSNASVS